MSSLSPSSTRLTADDRYELAAKAQNQQRLNYPKHLIVLGGLLVFVSIVVLVIAWQLRGSAIKANTRGIRDLAQIRQYIEEITMLGAAQENNPNQLEHEPIPDMLSQLKRFGTQAKLENEIGLPVRPKNTPQGNARKLTYPYTVRDPSLEHLLDWVKRSTQQIPGLEVTELTIKPGKQGWTLSVTFTRYERIE